MFNSKQRILKSWRGIYNCPVFQSIWPPLPCTKVLTWSPIYFHGVLTHVNFSFPSPHFGAGRSQATKYWGGHILVKRSSIGLDGRGNEPLVSYLVSYTILFQSFQQLDLSRSLTLEELFEHTWRFSRALDPHLYVASLTTEKKGHSQL